MSKTVLCRRCTHALGCHRWTYHRDPYKPATSKCDQCPCNYPRDPE